MAIFQCFIWQGSLKVGKLEGYDIIYIRELPILTFTETH